VTHAGSVRRRSWTTLAAAAAACLALSAPATAADGDLDPTFDHDGIERLPFGDAAEVALTPERQVIVVGDVPGGDTTSYVARLTPTGSFDPSFGEDGLTVLGAPGGVSMRDVVVQPDGRILVAGIVEPLDDGEGIVFRLTPDGDLDPTFAGDGSATFDFAGGHSSPRAMALQQDGRIVVVGQFQGEEESDFGVARLTANGGLDDTFAGDGTTTVDIGGTSEAARIVFLRDDRVVVAGSSGGPGSFDAAVVRLLPGGTPDGSFGAGAGAVKWPGMIPVDGIDAPGGGMLLAGIGSGAGSDMAALKLNPDGSRDTGFGPDGTRLYDFGGSSDAAAGIVQTFDGNYAIVGTSTTGTPPNFEPRLAALKITLAGEPVASFGDGGKRVYADLSRFRANDLLRQPDGKLVVGGADAEGMAVARILDRADLSPPPEPGPPTAPQPPRLDLTGGSAVEGQVLVFTARLSRPSDTPVTFGYVTGEGTAATGLDFGGRRGSVTIPPGQTSAPIGVATNADRFFETDETFRVELYDPAGARFGEYVAFGTIVNELRAGRCQNIVRGAGRTDVLTGSPGGDRISGRTDIDFLFGLAGDDCIFGEKGPDILDGGDGDDLVDGGSGNDRIRGGDGDDRLYGRRGINRYNGGPGDDRIHARNGRSEVVECGPGRDVVKADRHDRLRRCERVTR
jgi:uncharacterized delta-60 repeat protein